MSVVTRKHLGLAGIVLAISTGAFYGMKKGLDAHYEKYDAPMLLKEQVTYQEVRLERLKSGILKKTTTGYQRIHKEEYLFHMPPVEKAGGVPQ